MIIVIVGVTSIWRYRIKFTHGSLIPCNTILDNNLNQTTISSFLCICVRLNASKHDLINILSFCVCNSQYYCNFFLHLQTTELPTLVSECHSKNTIEKQADSSKNECGQSILRPQNKNYSHLPCLTGLSSVFEVDSNETKVHFYIMFEFGSVFVRLYDVLSIKWKTAFQYETIF